MPLHLLAVSKMFGSTPVVADEDFEIREGYYLIDTKDKAEALKKKLQGVKSLAVDTETDSLGALTSNMVGLSLSAKAGEAYYVTVKLSSVFASILADKDIKKYGHNLKYDIEVFHRAGLAIENIAFDSMIASYLLHPASRSHSLDSLAFVELKHQMVPIESLIGPKGKKQISIAAAPVDRVADYAAEDPDFTFRFVEKF